MVARPRRRGERPHKRPLDVQPSRNRRGQAAPPATGKGNRPRNNTAYSDPEVVDTRDVVYVNSKREGLGDNKENDKGSANRALGKRTAAPATHIAHQRKVNQSCPPFNDFSLSTTTRPLRKLPTRSRGSDGHDDKGRKHAGIQSLPPKQSSRPVSATRVDSPPTNMSARSAEQMEGDDDEQRKDEDNGREPNSEKFHSIRSEKVAEETTNLSHDIGDPNDTARSDPSQRRTAAEAAVEEQEEERGKEKEIDEGINAAAADQSALVSVYCLLCGRKFGGNVAAQTKVKSWRML